MVTISTCYCGHRHSCCCYDYIVIINIVVVIIVSIGIMSVIIARNRMASSLLNIIAVPPVNKYFLRS